MSIETVYREESGRILATLIRLLGDFDAAEGGEIVLLEEQDRGLGPRGNLPGHRLPLPIGLHN